MDNRRFTQSFFMSSVLAIVALCIIIAIYFFKPHTQTYVIYTTDSVSGLLKSAPVEFKGVPIGTVNQISLLDHDWVKIELQIQKQFQVKQSTAAIINIGGLTNRGYTGYVFIDLVDVKSRHPFLKPSVHGKEPMIPLLPSSSSSLDKTIKEMSEDIKHITQILSELLDSRTIDAIKELMVNMQKITHPLAKEEKTLINLLHHMDALSVDMRPFMQSSQSTLDTLNHELLPEMVETIVKIDTLSNSLLDLTTTLNRNPSVFIRGLTPQKPGPGENS